MISLEAKKKAMINALVKTLSSKLTLTKTTFNELTKVNIYINKIIIPPVNSSTTAYIIHEDKIFLKIKPR